MTRHALLWPLILALVLTAALAASAQEPGASPKGEAELREAIRAYDDALRRGDASAAERFWAAEYVFINPRGERVTREARIANLRERRIWLSTHRRMKSSARTWTARWPSIRRAFRSTAATAARLNAGSFGRSSFGSTATAGGNSSRAR